MKQWDGSFKLKLYCYSVKYSAKDYGHIKIKYKMRKDMPSNIDHINNN